MLIRAGLAFALWSVILLWPSTPRVLGDGPEYVTMAEKLSRFESPSMTVREVRERGLGQLTIRANDRWHEFVHFWLYPALIVPLRWLVTAVGVTPLAAFTTFNLVCLAMLLWFTVDRLEWPGLLFIAASPIWWWVDKPHTEVFTYCLLCAAFLWLPSRTHWSMIALGLASTQNPPIAALLLPCAVYAWRFQSVSSREFRIGAVVSIVLAALHPAYYLYRIGRVTALADSVRWPTIDLWGYVVWDPNVGLMFGDPWPLVIVALGVVALVSRRGRAAIERPLWAELGLAMLALCLFILAFAQTQNVNHGATPGMSRYALWLVPLTIPLWRIIDRGGALVRITAAGVSIASIVWTLLFFRPALPEGHLRPTSVAQFLWTGHPGLNNPLPEIFAERLGHREHAQPPIGTEGCEKVLLAEGRWPATCVPVPAPPICLLPQALCYGNRTAGGYAFVPTTSRGSGRPWTIR